MTIDFQALMAREFPVIDHHYTERDTMFYALSVGLGFEPTDERQLPFVYEDGLQTFPTMAAIMAYPGLWIREPDTGIDWEHGLHSEQGMEFLKSVPPAGHIRAQTRVSGIVDKGEGRGALIYTERTGIDVATGEELFRVFHTTFARKDGGFGGPDGPVRKPHPVPEREPDAVCDLPTLEQQALYYRLNGDPNPHNADPKSAAAAGFPRPILHGLCSYGFAGHAIVRACCDYNPTALKALHVRLSAPVFPGETLRTEIWREENGTTLAFRMKALERDVVVLNNGRAELT
ncbi:MAG: 3-alpha,7-alpha,12-alpha-trihydroxy-5-beta-cholest-24-enoyl-CoA hydratase [Rhodospirillaceae bacterium]|jgi:acyl dehydratase|nr:3-alpha,7-alpha,12-alpha-trihydroxy-5-beta-cholest-24-enoyl-CoA hydratase [Rhodospirillaceae bacterium]